MSAALDWSPPDREGIRSAWLTDPLKASLRGKRLRRADPGPALDIDAWPAAWRRLLAGWVRRAAADTQMRWESLVKAAGESGASQVQPLLDTLLAAGQIEIEEHRDPRPDRTRRRAPALAGPARPTLRSTRT